MNTAKFLNWTDKPFTAYWNGKPLTIKAGDSILLEDSIARNHAKHLTNKVLIESGNPLNESYTSPKAPEQIPAFMDLFNKAYIPTKDEEEMDEQGIDMKLNNQVLEKVEVKEPVEEVKVEVQEPKEEEFEGLEE